MPIDSARTGAPPSPPPGRKRRRRLATARNLKSAAADYLRALEDDAIDATKARVLFYGLSVLAGLIQGSELEQRVAQLERGEP